MQCVNERNYWALIGEDVVPCQCADEIRREKGNDNEAQKNVAVLSATKCNEVCKRIANNNCQQCGDAGITKTANELWSEFSESNAVVLKVPSEIGEEIETTCLARQRHHHHRPQWCKKE